MTPSLPRPLPFLAACCAACTPGTPQTPAAFTPPPAATLAASPTPTRLPPSPTQAPALAPAPRFFTETFDGPLPHWTYLQAGNGQPMAAPAVRDGFLVFQLGAPDQWGYAVYGGPAYADVTVEAVVQDRTGGDGAAGLLCRYDRSAGWYEFDVYADGAYRLLYGQWLADGVAAYTPLAGGESSAIQAGENTLRLECRGDTLAPSINGRPLRKWQELKFGLRTGRIGLAASSFADTPFIAAFDSLKVSTP